MKKLCIFLIGAVLLALFPGCAVVNRNEFAIYVVTDRVSYADATSTGIYVLHLQSKPIISNEDIVAYHWNSQRLDLTRAAVDRIRGLGVAVDGGQPFVVMVGTARIYIGAFWTPVSSISSNGIVILQPLTADQTSLMIQSGYPGSNIVQSPDERFDPRIESAFKNIGKLVHD